MSSAPRAHAPAAHNVLADARIVRTPVQSRTRENRVLQPRSDPVCAFLLFPQPSPTKENPNTGFPECVRKARVVHTRNPAYRGKKKARHDGDSSSPHSTGIRKAYVGRPGVRASRESRHKSQRAACGPRSTPWRTISRASRLRRVRSRDARADRGSRAAHRLAPCVKAARAAERADTSAARTGSATRWRVIAAAGSAAGKYVVSPSKRLRTAQTPESRGNGVPGMRGRRRPCNACEDAGRPSVGVFRVFWRRRAGRAPTSSPALRASSALATAIRSAAIARRTRWPARPATTNSSELAKKTASPAVSATTRSTADRASTTSTTPRRKDA